MMTNKEENKKGIAILGSTGSIGTQTLEVVRENKDLFSVEVLTANNNYELLIKQAIEFSPNCVVITNENHYQTVKDALWEHDIKTFTGKDALKEVVTAEAINMVVTAMVGFSGLAPTISAIEAKKNIALANKETLVVAGDIITQLAKENGVNIYPVDSEHSAIFQCLVGDFENPIEKIILTASGGPFRGKKMVDLQDITKTQALKHPNWTMGAKITIDSATLMNKGLEVIEAKWLFNLKANQIDVIVHPQSIIHSLVQFEDGSIKAQLGLPDMKLPIQYALGYPKRLKNNFERFNFLNYPELNFHAPDKKTFKNLDLAYQAIEKGGNVACNLNAANEVTVQAFLEDKIGFLQIAEINEKVMNQASFVKNPSLEDYFNSDAEARAIANDLL